MISDEFLKSNPIRRSSGSDVEPSGELEFTPEENADVLERLKQLGYIG